MSQTYQRITHTRNDAHNGTPTEEELITTSNEDAGESRAQIAIQFIVGALSSLLLIRFVLALFGASTVNSLIDLIYQLTNPLVAPFRDLFNLELVASDSSRFEVETLIATIFYTLIGIGLVRLLGVLHKQ